MATEEARRGVSAVRQVLAWLGYRVSGVVLLLLGLLGCIAGLAGMSAPLEEVVEIMGEGMSDGSVSVLRAGSGMALLMGAYVLVVGVQLCRGKLALFADLRSFLCGNFALAAAGSVFFEFVDEILYAFPQVTPAALAYIAAAGLWLWTAAKLLRGSRAPVADLRRFVGGNVALGLALFIMLAGALIADADSVLAPGVASACAVAGIALLALAARLLRVTAKRVRDDSDGGQAAKERN